MVLPFKSGTSLVERFNGTNNILEFYKRKLENGIRNVFWTFYIGILVFKLPFHTLLGSVTWQVPMLIKWQGRWKNLYNVKNFNRIESLRKAVLNA